MHMPQKRTTIKEVAGYAKVSTATVSYVLNQKEGQSISADTIERVREAAEELNYVPNRAAAALKTGKLGFIGVVLPGIAAAGELALANPAISAMLAQIELQSRLNGYQIMLCGRDAISGSLTNRRWEMDGLIFVGEASDLSEEDRERISCPAVLVDPPDESGSLRTVSSDDRAGGRLAVEYFRRRGHTKLAFAGGAGRCRDGWQEGLKQAGIQAEEILVPAGPLTLDFGKKTARALVKKGVTAVFADSDMLALCMMGGLSALGVRVPDDMSVMGFGDIPQAELAVPGLTTVHTDIREKSVKAVDLLLDAIDKKSQITHVMLPVSVVKRASVR